MADLSGLDFLYIKGLPIGCRRAEEEPDGRDSMRSYEPNVETKTLNVGRSSSSVAQRDEKPVSMTTPSEACEDQHVASGEDPVQRSRRDDI